jgi:hypothetical protein
VVDHWGNACLVLVVGQLGSEDKHMPKKAKRPAQAPHASPDASKASRIANTPPEDDLAPKTPSEFSEWLEGKIARLTEEADRKRPVWAPSVYYNVTREAYYDSLEICGDLDIEEPPQESVVCCGDKIEDALRRKALRWLQKLRDAIKGGPPRPVVFIFTPLQEDIWSALDGKAMNKEELAKKVCGGEGSRLYKKNGIKEMQEVGLVSHKHRVGYFRPDSPPENAIELNSN